MDSIDYLLVLAVSFGTGMGTAFGTETAKTALTAIREMRKRKQAVKR